MDIYLICANCKELRKTDTLTCNAFPNGIPESVVFGRNDHSEIIRGQVGKFVFNRADREDNTPLLKIGGASPDIEPYRISVESKDYRPKKKILKSAAKF